jgi:hypothetical protein
MVTQEGASHKFPNILIAVFIADGKIAILCTRCNAIALVKCLFYGNYEQCNIAIAVFVADGKITILCTRCCDRIGKMSILRKLQTTQYCDRFGKVSVLWKLRTMQYCDLTFPIPHRRATSNGRKHWGSARLSAAVYATAKPVC